ncbi:hypothetical protein RRX38_21485 [Pseudomonas sp. DTU_2021_1001937_2_SI_NGA_ILE_001]|uniref:hypothetical protein n=1 Tax=Pseudomonas sp. DTU_2021_1001937_2_SI_NGA_ILE_001 TaxID=3077589 RepID=UPI0028FC132A|nr:hypothetical protein [Pseudomonas sp. DTU_2021_1001937_2_SI_NGA_ILE_001]WNW13622.1 hypothetical protein RRX38_21485 [Pseudomonas sp. DTU_2021_1001937_2_SI_NGA_ILE_001]
MKPALLLLASLALGITQAQASTPQSWKQLDKTAQAACLKASQLKDVKTIGNSARFADTVGYDALLLEGRYPQKHMNNRRGTELCLFHRQSGQASVTEWDSIERR